MERRYIESFFFLGLLLAVGTAVVLLVLPFAGVLFLAAVFAFLFSEPFERLAASWHSRSLAAAAMALLLLGAILIPLTLAGFQIVREAGQLYSFLIGQTGSDAFGRLVISAQGMLDRIVPGATLDPQTLSASAQRALSWLIDHTATIFAGFGRIGLNFLLLLLFFYYLVRDGALLKHRVMELSPLSDSHEQEIFSRISQAVSSTVRGSLMLAFLQGLVSGVGFLIFGIPNPVLWGSIAVVAAFVPTVGTALVQIPAILYLLLTGHIAAGLGLMLWASIAVGLLDNALGPRLMAYGTRLHPLVMMIGVLGGIAVLGPIGLIAGPILMALLFALFDVYLSLVSGPELRR